MAKMGRAGLYSKWLEPDNLLRLESYARNGLTDDQIAHNIGITRSTLYEWKKKYKDFSDALKNGKEVVDIMVENALLKRALGYKYEEKKTEKWADQNGNPCEKVTVVEKEVVADTTAQIFWLKNRKPGDWKDRPMDSAVVEQINAASEMLISIRKVVE